VDHGVGWERDDAASERAGREHCTTAKTARHLLFPHEVLLVCQSQNSCRHARLNLRANRAVRCGGVRISTARVRRTRWELDARTRSRAPDWGSGELFEGVSDASRLPSWEKGKSNPHQVSALITRLEVLPPPFVVPRDVLEHGGRATLTKLSRRFAGRARKLQTKYLGCTSLVYPEKCSWEDMPIGYLCAEYSRNLGLPVSRGVSLRQSPRTEGTSPHPPLSLRSPPPQRH